MDNTNQTICLYSYNSRGSSSDTLDFVNDILEIPSNHCSIVRKNLYKLSKQLGNHSLLAKPALKNFRSKIQEDQWVGKQRLFQRTLEN